MLRLESSVLQSDAPRPCIHGGLIFPILRRAWISSQDGEKNRPFVQSVCGKASTRALEPEFQTAGTAVENRVSSGKKPPYPDGLTGIRRQDRRTEHRSHISCGTCGNPGQPTNSHLDKRCIPSQHLTEFPAYKSDRGGRILLISTTKSQSS